MTVEELKAEAKKLGYGIIPLRNREKLLVCTCGSNRRDHLSTWDYKEGKFREGLRCKKCGKEVWGDTEADVIHEWNEMIIKEQEH